MSAEDLRALIDAQPPVPEADGDERASVFFAEIYPCEVCDCDYTTEQGAYECEDWDRANGLDSED